MADRWIALIRAIGGATHRKMSMQALRDACEGDGLADVRTMLATGNLLVSTAEGDAALGARLRRILDGFGLCNEVFLRRPEELRAVLSANPFPEAAAERPSRLLVLFMARTATPEEIVALSEYSGPERMHVEGREVFIDYLDGVGTSKLTPAVLERRLGQPGTARNWNTIGRLAAG